MGGPDTLRAKTRVFLCLVFLAASASQARAANDSGSIKLKKLPPVAINVAAFPRLVAGADPAIVKRINKLLARGDGRVRNAARDCLRMGRKRADWSRKVSVTMQGPRYVSFVASDDYYCGGAYPDTSTVALVFDLNTGGSVDWTKLLPELAQRTGADTAGDGSTTLGTVSSDRLSDLYRDLAKRGGGDPECVDALKETELNFLLWPDAKQDGLVVQPDLAHVIAACGPALPIPLETLRSLGVDAGFLKAIAAAHRQGGG
jgi:hypothetical protein